ncbi:hypothetical protein A8990_10375 [Paenibacillus taihuensis]|uniref:Uncharacterized protein n=1 Tax=Paenibacillus taihuensis TaxID=1156355 RepID=A0A3D9SDW3_9BACL|nr:hypothetical protein [Paenibacillus taihuensis]REE92777.1 hypothetical protein A8990_10375 [Paenibacillus taihuensis]
MFRRIPQPPQTVIAKPVELSSIREASLNRLLSFPLLLFAAFERNSPNVGYWVLLFAVFERNSPNVGYWVLLFAVFGRNSPNVGYWVLLFAVFGRNSPNVGYWVLLFPVFERNSAYVGYWVPSSLSRKRAMMDKSNKEYGLGGNSQAIMEKSNTPPEMT